MTTRPARIAPRLVSIAKPFGDAGEAAHARLRAMHDTGRQRLAPDRLVGQQRIDLAFGGAQLGADDARCEVGRDAVERGAIQHLDLQAELLLAPALLLQECVLLAALRHHQPAGDGELDVLAEPRGQRLPVPHGARVERQRLLEGRHHLGIEPHEAALQLHVQSAGIGDGAGVPAVIDHGHVMALLGQEPGEAHADDAAAHDHRADFGRRAPSIMSTRHGEGEPRRTRSPIATGLAGTRGAKKASSSTGRPCRSASSDASTGAQ